jgi:glycosyl transferase family 25
MNFEFNNKNTFCISLLSNKTRNEKMKKRLEILNLDSYFWTASTPETLTDTFYKNLNVHQKACAQSHYNIWKYIIENNLEYALILEDDACFDKSFFRKINQFSEDVDDPEWDAIFLNASESIEIKNKWVLVNDQYLTGGYILSNKGCKNLIEMYSKKLLAADWMTVKLQLLNHSYSYFPWVIIQEGNETTIGSDVDTDHKRVVQFLEEANYSLDNYII